MSTLKRTLALLAALAITSVSFAACGDDEDSSSSSSSAADSSNASSDASSEGDSSDASSDGESLASGVELSTDTIDYTSEEGTMTIISWTADDANPMVEVYTEKSGNSNVKVELVAESGGDASTKYDAYLLGGNDVDIFMCDVDWVLKYAKDTYALPLSEVGITEADLANQFSYTVAIGKAPGELYASSFQATPGGYVYNNALAEEHLGVTSGDAMQEKMKDWDAFKATAAELKDATNGEVYICPTLGGLWQVYATNRSEAWVTSDNKLNVGEAAGFVDLAKELVDNGYVDANITQWSDDWAPMGANGKALGFFACTWCVKEKGGQLEGWQGETGDWTLIAGPQAYSWGGTFLCVGKNSDNKGMAGDFIKSFTVNEQCMYEYALATGDFVNNKNVMGKIVEEGSNSNALLGGQDQFAVFAEVAPKISMDGLVTEKDATIKSAFLTAVTNYCKGDASEWEDSFKKAVAETYADELNWD